MEALIRGILSKRRKEIAENVENLLDCGQHVSYTENVSAAQVLGTKRTPINRENGDEGDSTPQADFTERRPNGERMRGSGGGKITPEPVF